MVKKIAYYIYIAVVALFLVWVAVSFLDIVADNNSTAPAHSALNFFSLLAKGATV